MNFILSKLKQQVKQVHKRPGNHRNITTSLKLPDYKPHDKYVKSAVSSEVSQKNLHVYII